MVIHLLFAQTTTKLYPIYSGWENVYPLPITGGYQLYPSPSRGGITEEMIYTPSTSMEGWFVPLPTEEGVICTPSIRRGYDLYLLSSDDRVICTHQRGWFVPTPHQRRWFVSIPPSKEIICTYSPSKETICINSPPKEMICTHFLSEERVTCTHSPWERGMIYIIHLRGWMICTGYVPPSHHKRGWFVPPQDERVMCPLPTDEQRPPKWPLN